MTKWEFWRAARDWCNGRMKSARMEGGNCDSCCPRCHQWESHGNNITTKDREDGSMLRNCSACQYVWVAIFTPAGFIPVDVREIPE